jgi:hypothetical protein
LKYSWLVRVLVRASLGFVDGLVTCSISALSMAAWSFEVVLMV